MGNGLAGASTASSPKRGNRTSKMAHKAYATLRVTVNESACTFQESGFGSVIVGAGDFASAAAFGAAATGVKGVEGFAAGATGDGFGGAAGVADGGVDGCAIGAALSCCLASVGTATGGTAAAAPVDAFGMAASGFAAEAGATFGVGTASGLRAGSCSLPLTGSASPAGRGPRWCINTLISPTSSRVSS